MLKPSVLHEFKLRRFFLSLVIGLIVLAISIIISLSIGSTSYGIMDVLKTIAWSIGLPVQPSNPVIFELRFTRSIVAVLSGACLGIAGVLVQSITRNPLAEPFLLGLSSTALTFVSVAALVAPFLLVSRYSMVAIAFIGALIGFTLTLTLSEIAGGSPLTLILAGIAVSSVFSGLSHVLAFLVQSKLNMPFIVLLMGTFSTSLKLDIAPLAATFVLGFIVSMLIAKPLNTLLYGDEYAGQLGYNPRLIRRLSSLIASLLTGATVAIAGIIGFVGLVVPHLARMMVGGDNRVVIPLAAIIGGSLLVLSDIVIRIISSQGIGELPVSAITSIIGAPFFAYLLAKKMREVK